jgi:FKBP-type peptidyl-prolyl cis-trans isomerase SlyD
MKICANAVASIEYSLRDDSGELLDSSEESGALSYLHGSGTIIEGLERLLEGKEKGASFNAVIEPADAYGERDEGLVMEIPRSNFPVGESIEAGMQFQADTGSGPRIFTVIEASDRSVTVDGNHPLAGERLHFEVRVADVRPATPEEIERGLDDCGCGCGEGHGCGDGCGCH